MGPFLLRVAFLLLTTLPSGYLGALSSVLRVFACFFLLREDFPAAGGRVAHGRFFCLHFGCRALTPRATGRAQRKLLLRLS